MYARDLGSRLYEEFAKALAPDKLLNLATIFAIFDLPDCAAEIVLQFRDRISSLCDVDRMLDLLTAQAERSSPNKANYKSYLEQFESEPSRFLGTKNPLALAARAARQGYRKWRGRQQLLRMERKAP